MGGADQDFERQVLRGWRLAGRERVVEHSAELNELVRPIDSLIDGKRHEEAALAAQIAANHAVLWHPGFFAHAELERQLHRLGQEAAMFAGRSRPPKQGSQAMAVLHVATDLAEINGHTRMIARWVEHDKANRHTLALTRQSGPVPGKLCKAIAGAGGNVHRINLGRGGLLDWARDLQRLIAEADLVVLHVHSMDVVPFIAIAGMKRRPPVALLNHADHLFWLGVSFVDQVISSRRSGFQLCIDRRGVAPERNTLLPLCLELPVRTRSRDEAKRQLGLQPDSIVILTIARALKFYAVEGTTFADTLVPVLRRNPNAHLIAVGPGGKVDWSAAEAAVPGRIRIIKETPDTQIYLEAADIYVDSFPFVSITSLSEAGLFGLPLVTRTPFGNSCAVMAADSPGFDDVVLHTRSPSDFHDALERLIRDPALRLEIGQRTEANIEAVNVGEGWRRELAKAYERALNTPREAQLPPDPHPCFDDLDLFIPLVFEHPKRGASAASRRAFDVELMIKAARFGWRLRALAGFAIKGQLGLLEAPAWRLLIPEWLGSRIRTVLPRRQPVATVSAKNARPAESDRAAAPAKAAVQAARR